MGVERMLVGLRRRTESEYRRRTPKSRALHERDCAYLPAGDTRSGTAFAPYPTYIERGAGCYLYDVDGQAILDFTQNATSLIHGHAHPAIVSAIQQQAATGTAWAAPNPHQVRLAQILCERVPSVERVRFSNSGTEANMQAIKVARAFSGRDKILKMSGAYHGTYEGVEFTQRDGAAAPTTRGIPRNAAANVLVATFGDERSAERLILEHRAELAAVVVNPVQTSDGLLLRPEDYLGALRDLTRECGALLIFDEVISLRIASGGAQAHFGVTPDLTALGKLIGGGLPVGALGGRAEIMRLFADGNPPAVSHAGTFNGNPLTMAAGVAAMELLTPEAYRQLARLGRHLTERLQWAVREVSEAFAIRGIASLVSWQPSPSLGANPAMAEIMRLIQLALLNRGIKTYRFFAASTVMSEREINQLATTLHAVLADFRPAIAALMCEQAATV